MYGLQDLWLPPNTDHYVNLYVQMASMNYEICHDALNVLLECGDSGGTVSYDVQITNQPSALHPRNLVTIQNSGSEPSYSCRFNTNTDFMTPLNSEWFDIKPCQPINHEVAVWEGDATHFCKGLRFMQENMSPSDTTLTSTSKHSVTGPIVAG